MTSTQPLADSHPRIDDTKPFSWTNTDIVACLSEQPRTAVYVSGDGSIVVRQYQWPDDDLIVTFNAHCVPAVIEALRIAAEAALGEA